MAADCKETEEYQSRVKEKPSKIKENPTCNGDLEYTASEGTDEHLQLKESLKSGKEPDDSTKNTNCGDSKNCAVTVEKIVEQQNCTKMNGENGSTIDCDKVKDEDEQSTGEKVVDDNAASKKQITSVPMAPEKSDDDKYKSSASETKSGSVTSADGVGTEKKEFSGNKVNGEGPVKKDLNNKKDESTKENVDRKKKVSKVTQVLKGAKTQTLNLRPIAQMLFDIGMDLTRQNVYRDLIKIQKKKDAMDKLESKEKEQLVMLSDSYDNLLTKNESFMIDTIHCSHCGYKTDSINVMEYHREYAHDQDMNNFTCAICGSVTKVATAFLYHMEAVHKRKGRLVMKHAFFVCPYCPYESNSRGPFQKHIERCSKVFRETHNLVPLAPDCDIPLKQLKPPEKRQPKVAPKPVPPPKPVIREVPRPQAKPTLLPSAIPEKVPPNKVAISHIPPKTSIVTRAPHPQQPPPPQVPAMASRPPTAAQSAAAQSAAAQNAAALVQMNGQWYRLTTIGAQQFLLPAPAPSVNQMPVTRPQIIVQNQLSVPGQAQGKGGNFEVCEICGGFVKDRDSLRIHFYWAHKVDIHKDVFKAQVAPLSCPICQKSGKEVHFWTYQGLSRHRSNEHKDINISSADRKAEPNGLMKEIPKQCVVCSHVYHNTTTPQQYWSHMEMHGITSAKLFLLRKCLICGVAINEPKRLEKHLLTSHASLFDKNVLAAGKSAIVSGVSPKESVKSPPKSKPLVVCDMCKISFPTVVVYQRHLDVVHTFKCTRCSQKLSSREVLMQHFHDIHGNEKDGCPICHTMVKIGRSMVRHLKSEHIRVCSVPLTRIRKAEVLKYMEKRGKSIEKEEESPKARKALKRKSDSSGGNADDIIMIDLDSSPLSKLATIEIRKCADISGSKKQILEVDGEEIVVEIQQDGDSSESEDDEQTKSASSIVLEESKSDNNLDASNSAEIGKEVAKEDVKEADKEADKEVDKEVEAPVDCDAEKEADKEAPMECVEETDEKAPVDCDKEEETDKEAPVDCDKEKVHDNDPEDEEIEISDGEEEEEKNQDQEEEKSEGNNEEEEGEIICEDISSDENDDEVEESENEVQDGGSIDISSDDDDEVMDTD